MSKVGQLVELVREEIREADEQNSHFSNAQIIRLIDRAQKILSVDFNLIITRDSSFVSDTATRYYTLPSSFKSMIRVRYDGERLDPTTRRREDLNSREWEDDTDSATPTKYFIERPNFVLVKIPAVAADTIDIIYNAFSTTLTAYTGDIQIPAVLEAACVDFAVYKLRKSMKMEYKSYKDDWEEGYFLARNVANNINKDLTFEMDDISRRGSGPVITHNAPETYG